MPKTSKHLKPVQVRMPFPPLTLTSANLAVAEWVAKERLRYDLDRVAVMQGAFDGAPPETWWTVGSDGKRLLAVEARPATGVATPLDTAPVLIPTAPLTWLRNTDADDSSVTTLTDTDTGITFTNRWSTVNMQTKQALSHRGLYPNVSAVLPKLGNAHIQWPMPEEPWLSLLTHVMHHTEGGRGAFHLRLHDGKLLEWGAKLDGVLDLLPMWGVLAFNNESVIEMGERLERNEGANRNAAFDVSFLHALTQFAYRHSRPKRRGPDTCELHLPLDPDEPLFFRCLTNDTPARRVIAIVMPVEADPLLDSIRQQVHAPVKPGAPVLEAAHVNPLWDGLQICMNFVEHGRSGLVARTHFETSDLLAIRGMSPLPPAMNADAYLPVDELKQALQAAAQIKLKGNRTVRVGHDTIKNLPVLTVIGDDERMTHVLAGRLHPAVGSGAIDRAVAKLSGSLQPA